MRKINSYSHLISTSNSFVVQAENLIIAVEDALFIENGKRKIIYPSKIYSFSAQNIHNIVFQAENGSDLIFYKNTHYHTILGKFYLWSALIVRNKLIIRGTQGADIEKKVYSIDLETSQIEILDFNIVPDFIFHNIKKYLTIGLNCVFLYESGIELWRFDLSLWREWCSHEDLRQLSPNIRIVDATEQSVILATSYGTGCIDIQSGKLIWFREKINPKKSRTAFIQLHEGIFKEINPLNGETIYEIDLTESFTQNGYLHWKSSSNCELLDDRLVAFTITTFHSILVVFDKFTAEIVWYHLFQDENGFKISLPSDNLQVHKNRIYVLDSTETLHIFENEN